MFPRTNTNPNHNPKAYSDPPGMRVKWNVVPRLRAAARKNPRCDRVRRDSTLTCIVEGFNANGGM